MKLRREQMNQVKARNITKNNKLETKREKYQLCQGCRGTFMKIPDVNSVYCH